MAISGVGAYEFQNSTKSRSNKASYADFGKELSAASAGTKGDEKKNTAENRILSTAEILQMISERKSEILKKVKKGETEPVIQIGGQAYTEKQWERMLESFDDSEEEIKNMIREALEKYKKAQKEE